MKPPAQLNSAVCAACGLVYQVQPGTRRFCTRDGTPLIPHAHPSSGRQPSAVQHDQQALASSDGAAASATTPARGWFTPMAPVHPWVKEDGARAMIRFLVFLAIMAVVLIAALTLPDSDADSRPLHPMYEAMRD